MPVGTFSYTGSPYCQNAPNPSPSFSGGGTAGTFSSSAGLSIDAITGAVNLSSSTAGTYTVTNTIAASGGCSAVSATAGIIINPVQNAAFNYSSPSYCQTGINPTPTITGTAGGTFTSSPAGLAFVSSSSGEINLSASALNTYTITYTTAGPCASSGTTTVSITGAPAATFSYTGSPYCQNGTDPSPVFSGGGTGGVFSSSAGLNINPANGTITLASSTAGTYTVTNTIPASGGCASVTATANIMINPLQNSSFNYSSSTFCQAGVNPTPIITGVAGGTFSGSPAGIVFVSNTTGEINLSASSLNTYTITYTTAGPCASSSTVSVTISNPTSATISYNGPYCQNATNPFPVFGPGSSAGNFTASSGGLVFASTATGEIDLLASTPGSYTVTNTIAASGACPASVDTATITITSPPAGAFTYAGSPYCSNSPNQSPVFTGGGIAGTFSASSSSLVFVSTGTGEIDLTASLPGTYTISNTLPASGGCAAITETTSITINPLQNASFNYSSSTFCQSGTNPVASITGTGGGFFSATPAGLTFVNSSTGEINLAASGLNTYTITYTTPGPCANTSTVSVTITNAPAATFTYAGPYCQNDPNPSPTFTGAGTAGTFTSSLGLIFISSATGQVDLAASTPGIYSVTNTIPASGGCAAVSEVAGITISPLQSAAFSYSASTYCQAGTNPTPVISGTSGGLFSSSPSGLSFVNTNTGEINLSTSSLNTYTVTYTTSGPCANMSTVTVTITSAPVATFSYTGTPYCQNATNPSPVFSAGGSAGTFTSSTGLSINATNGDINLASSTPGSYTVTNTITASGCPSAVAYSSIEITAPQTTAFSYTGSPYCQNAANPSPVIGSGSVAGTFTSGTGLVFISSSTGEIDLAASATGNYTITNTIPASGGCPASSSTTGIIINPVQNAAFNYSASTFCSTGSNPSPIITGTAGGTFTSSPAGLVFVSASTGEINLSASTLSTYSITYTTAGPCASSSNVSVTITNSPSALFSYAGSPYCQSASNPSPSFGSGSSAGVFTSSPGLSIDASTGIINLSASSAGTYSITNTIPASGGCPATNATTSITITAPQTGIFNYPSSPYCQNGSNPSPVLGGGSVAGTFSSSGGITVSSATGLVDLASSSPGTYTVTNTIPASGGCPAINETSSITISPLQNAAFSYSSSSYCQSSTNPSPVVSGVSGGSFTASPVGLNLNPGTGLITLSTSSINTYTVTYTTPGPCANSSTTTVTITTSPVAVASGPGSVCEGSSINLTSSGGSTYNWSGPGIFTSGSQNPIISSATPANSGTYTVTASNGGCADTAQVNVLVNPTPVVYAGADEIIFSGNAVNLNAAGGTSYSWTPSTGLSCSNCPDPVASPTETTTYCVTSSNNGCSASDCMTVLVKIPCNSKELGVPNAFSPNNDGNNDQFCLQGWSECMNQFSILIFDRWGEKVFESTEADFCWDGTFRGKAVDPAVFVYIINASFFNNENVIKKGNITIIK
jgi:gliding motility-associated-like protein